MARRMFDKERELAASARNAISALRPLRFSTDWLLAEIATGGERARDIVSLILYVEDLSVALTETIGTAEESIKTLQNKLVAASVGPVRDGR